MSELRDTDAGGLGGIADQAASLCVWYAAHKRDLPWRRQPANPYHVLLSELMLQQTRVETVIPYFERFVARWPTLDALAQADEQAVLKEWAGLGYYSRARNLLSSARACATGGLPTDVASLRRLPGIGPYTAGAIASIAFGVTTPVVDGNVERVLTRLCGLAEDPRRSGRKKVWEMATQLVQSTVGAPGDLNQALMELGATVCTPKQPRCEACPLAEGCVGLQGGDPTQFPRLAKRAPPVPMRGAFALVQQSGGMWLGRRPKGLLSGLWEPLGIEWAEGGDPKAVLGEALQARTGVVAQRMRFLGVVQHTFTHRRLLAEVFEVDIAGTPTACMHYEEVRQLVDPEDVPLSTLARRLLACGSVMTSGTPADPGD